MQEIFLMNYIMFTKINTMKKKMFKIRKRKVNLATKN